MSISPEDAVARAKAIAAKLSGGAPSTESLDGAIDASAIAMAAQAALDSALGGKRKRWGVSGEDGDAAAASKKPKEAADKKFSISCLDDNDTTDATFNSLSVAIFSS